MSEAVKEQDISTIAIEEEMRGSYLDYAMSVIVSRALPDVRDGLKPVHRRILYAMKEGNYDYNRPYRKSARIVGEVVAKYHPHGTEAVYDTLVRMAQDFSMRLELADGQGNFGSMDGDKAAAMRYTEVRMTKASHYLCEDIEKDTVDFRPNYDESLKEPSVLPTRIPNLLVNGAGGIAVGMATNIPPHNLNELIDGCLALIDQPDLSLEELMELIPGPDFPTGGIIMGRRGIYNGFMTGRGSLAVRARTSIEDFGKGREAIIVTEIPYQVNKSKMIERIAELVNAKELEGISDLRDESDKDGVRVVIELKKDAVADVILNRLYTMTPMQSSFGMNMLALHAGRPVQMSLRDMLNAFLDFREVVITRRTRYLLMKARERAHVLIGLALAVANIDEMIKLIKEAADPQTAKEQIMAREWAAGDVEPLIKLVDEPDYPVINGTYKMSEAQAKAILELRLHRLTGLEREKIAGELEEIVREIKGYLDILASRELLLDILRQELAEVKELFGTPRRTTIEEGELTQDEEDLIQKEDMVVTVSMSGYIKRTPVNMYRAQRRGGKGKSGMNTREEDVVSEVFVANTHTQLLFFTTRGMVHAMKVYRLPMGNLQARGKAIVNLLPLEEGEKISTIMSMPDDKETWDKMEIMFATSKGGVRRNALSDFTNIRANGKIAMKLDEDSDEDLIAVKVCDERSDVLLTTRSGRCIRFGATDVRQFASRNSTGVRGVKLGKDDVVVSMSILNQGDFTMEEREAYLKLSRNNGDGAPEGVSLPEVRQAEMKVLEQFILSVSENGFGKRTSSYEYRSTNRGGQGITTMDVTAKTGQVVDSFPVEQTDDVMLVTDGGQLIRCPVKQIRVAGRRTQGVTLFKVAKGEKVVSVTRILDDGEEGEEVDTSPDTEHEEKNDI